MSTEVLTDEALMWRFRETLDIAAFDVLARRYHKPAISVARGRLGSHGHMAEDVVQETFLRILRHRDRFDTNRSFSPWFYAILRNACADIRRERMRHTALLERFGQDPSFHAESSPATPAEDDILERLAPADREILIYRLVHDMSFEEISAQLGCSLESAKKRAQRALRRLRQAASADHANGKPAVIAG